VADVPSGLGLTTRNNSNKIIGQVPTFTRNKWCNSRPSNEARGYDLLNKTSGKSMIL
jgi:hypothetical protein